MKKVLVSAARMPIALEICRALARCGATVFTADSFPVYVCQASRAVTRSYRVPAPRLHFQAYRREILNIIRREAIELLIPCSEDVLYLARLAHEVGPGCEIFAPPLDLLQSAHHKQDFIELAQTLGLPAPRSMLYRQGCELPSWCRQQYVLKQAYSRAGQAVIFAAGGSRPEEHGVQADGQWLVQEKLEGETLCSCSIVHHGEVVAHLAYRPTVMLGSVGAVFREIEQPAIRQWVARFAKAFNWHGMLSFDFILDREGKAAAIECNPRPTSGVHLYPRDLLGQALLSPRPCPHPGEGTRRAQVLMGMISALPSLIRSGTNRAEKLLDILRARDVTASWRDPLPFFHQFACYGWTLGVAWKTGQSLPATLMDDFSWDGDKDNGKPGPVTHRRASLASVTVRRAGPADNLALIELARACPMKGLLEMYSDRSPDFFAMNAVQSPQCEVWLAESSGSRLFGCAAFAEKEGHWQGRQVLTLDMCDLRMDARYRRSRTIADFIRIYARHLRSGRYHHGVCEILEGNHAAVNIQRLLGEDFAIHFDGFANFYQLLPVKKYRPPSTWHYRQATACDLPAIVEVLRASHGQAIGAPAFSVEWLRQALEQHASFGMEHMWLALDGNEQVLACVGLWDQVEIRRTVVTRFTPGIRRATGLLRLLGLVWKLPPLPQEGQALRYLFLRWPAAAPGQTAALAALCRFVMNRVREEGRHQFASIGFFEDDHLQEALHGMLKLKERIQLFSHWLKDSSAHRERPASFGRRYVDLPLV